MANRRVSGRLAILAAVILMAIGKVAYGTWLSAVPSPLYVLVSFSLITLIFLPFHGRKTGQSAPGPLLLLNISTALCFLFFFYALKLLEPAVAGAVQFGMGPILAALITLATTGTRPTPLKAVVCMGLLSGCILLAASAVNGSGIASDNLDGWLGLAAILASGTGSVLITMSSKALSQRGWSSGAILAHRCYLIVPLALILTVLDQNAASVFSTTPVPVLLAIAILGTILPICLLQIGIERTDPHTVMVMMAGIPVFTFLVEGFSPLYVWSFLTASGLAVITAFILLDVFGARPATGLSRARRPTAGQGARSAQSPAAAPTE